MLPVGYLPCTQDPPAGKNMARVIEEMIAEAQAAEAHGWDGCFITEHHQQEDGYLQSQGLDSYKRINDTGEPDLQSVCGWISS